MQAKVGNFRFFVVSARRPQRPDGASDGIVAIGVLPERLRESYACLVADSFGLVRSDFRRAVAREPEAGILTTVPQVDGIERCVGFRCVPGYVQAGIETAAMGRELRDALLGHLAFGLPATLALVILPLCALQGLGRIVLVDDNAEVAEVARSYPEEFGYGVLEAQSVEALEILHASSEIAIVLSDAVMPGAQNGLDLARHVRSEPGGRIAVLLATGYSDVAQAAAAEGSVILRKPYDSHGPRESLDRARARPILQVVG